jgi:hypothetical protein
MPTILVKSNASTEQGSTVTLEETVEPEQLASDPQAAEFIERVGWALTDAKDAEETSGPLPRSAEEPPYDPGAVERDVYEKLYGRPKRVDRVPPRWRG